jgi:uncharacterized protein
MTKDLASTPKAERIEILDAIRGFALFGILVANIRDHSGWDWYDLDHQAKVALAGEMVVRATDFLNLMLVNGKFYTIFSFLFGMGFSLQLSRLERNRFNGIRIFRRRLLLLLAIGLVHMSTLYGGDILTLYAVLGLVLPLVYKWSDRKLISTSAVLILLPIVGYTIIAVMGVQPDFGLEDVGYRLGGHLFMAFNGYQNPSDLQWVRLEDWNGYWAFVLSNPPFRLGTYLENWRIPKVLGVMMIGLWAGRRLIDGRLLEDRSFLKRVAIVGFAVGLPMNVAYAWLGGLSQEQFIAGLQATTVYALGVVPLGLAYAATFALVWPYAPKLLSILQAPGRMALTNYLMQSLICKAIFFGVGLGFIGYSPPAAFYSLAIAIFAFQILFSNIWLKNFRQGPMEWLWRRWTYSGRNHQSGDQKSTV